MKNVKMSTRCALCNILLRKGDSRYEYTETDDGNHLVGTIVAHKHRKDAALDYVCKPCYRISWNKVSPRVGAEVGRSGSSAKTEDLFSIFQKTLNSTVLCCQYDFADVLG